MKNSLSPVRKSLRLISTSVCSEGRTLVSLLITSVTSATFSGFLVSVPLKMTSSIRPARSVFVDCSPSTHLIASTILLFPQPFGPSNEVVPSANSRQVLSAKDLKPYNSTLLRNNGISNTSSLHKLRLETPERERETPSPPKKYSIITWN